jgi:integrase
MARTKKFAKQRGIFEREKSSGQWWIRYQGSDGKAHREFCGSHRAAEQRLELRHTERREGKAHEIKGAVKPKVEEPKVVTFGDLIEDCLNYSRKNNDAVHTYELQLKFKKLDELAKLPVADVTRATTQDLLDELADDNEWSGSTYNRYLAAVSLAFRVAIDNGRAEVNPLTRLRRKQENNARVRFLSQDEEARLTSTITRRNPEYLPVYLLALHSGMRLSEQLRAQVGDFNPSTGMLLIRQKKVRNAPATRYVPLTPIGIQACTTMAASRPNGQPLCVNYQGEALSGSRYWFDPAIEEAGIREFTWHCLRHSFASRAVMAGTPLAVVSKYLGHSTIQQTMVYSHLQPDNAARTVAALMSYYPSDSGTKPAPEPAPALSASSFPQNT